MTDVSSQYLSYFSSQLRHKLFLLAFLIVIWPFGAFLYALFQYDKPESKFIFIFFTALFGYSLVAESSGLDLYRVMQSLPAAAHLNFKDFNNSRVEAGVDIYRDMVTFLVSRFTSNAKWLMGIFGLISGYFYTRVISLFVTEQPGRNIYKLLLIISFSCIISIDQLSGVRMSLAAYVFFFGAIKVILKGDKRYLIVAASSVLIHFSFFSIVLLLFAFPTLKKYPKIIFLILIISFVVPNLLKSYILQFSGFFGKGIAARTEMYYNIDLKGAYGAIPSWYVRYNIISMLIFCYLILFITFIRKKTIKYSDKANDLFYFSLIVLSFVNFTIEIPHFGYRFQYVFLMFSFYYFYKVYTENPGSTLILNLVWISVPFSLLQIVYSFRSTLSITPLSFYYFTWPGLIIDHSTQSAWSQVF